MPVSTYSVPNIYHKTYTVPILNRGRNGLRKSARGRPEHDPSPTDFQIFPPNPENPVVEPSGYIEKFGCRSHRIKSNVSGILVSVFLGVFGYLSKFWVGRTSDFWYIAIQLRIIVYVIH